MPYTDPVILGQKASIVNQIVAELRAADVQADRLRFRTNLERLGEILAYEISSHLPYTLREVVTPLGSLEVPVLAEQPVLCTILRAGLPLQAGMLRMLDLADCAFISAYRKHTTGNEFIIKVEYCAAPDLEGRDIILIDPMIATGKSLVLSYQQLLAYGTPRSVYVAGAIASDIGLEYLLRNIPHAKIFIAAVDTELTAKSYIVPGLGDAGDLAYGYKA
jgi:uracil phosphoribosyltransferase